MEKLLKVQRAESAVRALGFRGFRLRHHDRLARLEFLESDLDQAFGARGAIVRGVKEAGYAYVTLDLEGYRQGNMNLDVPPQLISIQKKPRATQRQA